MKLVITFQIPLSFNFDESICHLSICLFHILANFISILTAQLNQTHTHTKMFKTMK